MTELVNGNILQADVEALVNTVNTVGIMGKGIALQFKKAFPEMFEDYRKACAHKEVEIGRMHIFDRGSFLNPRYIINFPTKQHWKGKSRLADIEAGLKDLLRQVATRGIQSIAVPPLGCGHGGLDWEVVRPRIVEAFHAVPDIRVLIYEPAGAPAPEEQVNRTKRPAMNPTRANVLRVLSRYRVLDYALTLLEAQKLLYFLQVAGEPLKLRFAKHAYGPYADNLRHLLQRFEGHFIQGIGEGRNTPSTIIEVSPDALREAEQFVVGHAEGVPETEDRLERVTKLIEGFQSPLGLELLSSVHWVASHPDEQATDPESIICAIQNWNERKQRIMKPQHIRIALRRLQEQGWVP